MSMVKGLRLFNSLQANCICGTWLETCLTTDKATCSDFVTTFNLPGQTCILTMSPTALAAIGNSCTAICAVMTYCNPRNILGRSPTLCNLLTACSAYVIGGSADYLCNVVGNCCAYNYYFVPNLNPQWCRFSCGIITSSESRNFASKYHGIVWAVDKTWPNCTTLWTDSWKFNQETLVCRLENPSTPKHSVRGYSICVGPNTGNGMWPKGYSWNYNHRPNIIDASCGFVYLKSNYCFVTNCIYPGFALCDACNALFCSTCGDILCGLTQGNTWFSDIFCYNFCGTSGTCGVRYYCTNQIKQSFSSNTAMSVSSINCYCMLCGISCGCTLGIYWCPVFYNLTSNGISQPICGCRICGFGGLAWSSASGYPALCAGLDGGNQCVACSLACLDSTAATLCSIISPFPSYVACSGRCYSGMLYTENTPVVGGLLGSNWLNYTSYSGVNCTSYGEDIPNNSNFYAFSYAVINRGQSCGACLNIGNCGQSWMNVPVVACYDPLTCCAVVCSAPVDTKTLYACCLDMINNPSNFANEAGFCGISAYTIGVKGPWCALWIPNVFGSDYCCGLSVGSFKCGNLMISMCGSKTFNRFTPTITGGNFGQLRCLYSVGSSPAWLAIVSCCGCLVDCLHMYRTTNLTTWTCVANMSGNSCSCTICGFVTNCGGMTIGWSSMFYTCWCLNVAGQFISCNTNMAQRIYYSLDCGNTWTRHGIAEACIQSLGKYTGISNVHFNPSSDANGTIIMTSACGYMYSSDGYNWKMIYACDSSPCNSLCGQQAQLFSNGAQIQGINTVCSKGVSSI